MNLLGHTKTLKLFKRIFDSKNSTETIIPYYPQKIEFNFGPKRNAEYIKNDILSPKLLHAFLKDIESDRTVNLHSLCISVNGKTVLSFASPYHSTVIPHAVHSASKSVTSLACGILITSNNLSLNDKLCDILPEIYNPITKFVQKNITVKDLLTMSTGVGFNETEIYSYEHYDKAFSSSPLAFTPGTEFAYNSLNSYMLGRIVEKISGQKLSVFVDENIFKPLGITNYQWEECPKGHTKGGWGLYLSTEDMLKLGNLYLNNGKFGDKQIVSSEWISEATTKKIAASSEMGKFDYGYHIWISEDNSCYLLNGMFGQNVFCFNESKICIATNGGIDDFFQMNNIYNIVSKHFKSPSATKSTLLSHIKFKLYLNKLSRTYQSVKIYSNHLDFNREFKKIRNRSYEIVSSNSASVGILPVVLQILQNNYTKGITKFSFNDRSIYISDSGRDYNIPIDGKKVSQSKLNFNGEIYNVASSADFALNEFGETVLKIRLDFNETASTRYINITFKGNEVKIKLYETPELEFLFANMNYFLKDINIKSVREAILNGFDSTLSKSLYDNAFNPELKGKLIK